MIQGSKGHMFHACMKKHAFGIRKNMIIIIPVYHSGSNRMIQLLSAIIYLAFIRLELPDMCPYF